MKSEKSMEKIVSLCKSRGIIYPGSEIYGGLANTWDYGPLGVEFKNNVKKAWWKKFIQESPYNVGVDCAILMNPQTWVASGHLGSFSDPLMDCKCCHERFRADKLIEDLKEAEQSEDITHQNATEKSIGKIDLQKEIIFSDVVYSYPNSNKAVLDDAKMIIPVGKSIGIVGKSGAGKTTVVDIILGLLKPSKGFVYSDGKDIFEFYKSWISHIGYIPQSIFMLDDTIRANVAFGIDEEQLCDDKVWDALREAQLEGFVKSLPEGLDTQIGERGVRLSGGQRQRIGIARALYENPELLIFDEATSALDNETEAAIMESINRLHGKKTIIIIAHRLQTIESCDIVYRVENGKIYRDR